MDIGVVSRTTGLAASAIRYYEELGLLGVVARGQNGRRRYAQEHIARLDFIGNCRETGMSLEAVAALISLTNGTSQPCPEARPIVEGHIDRLRTQLNQMQGFLQKLEAFSLACTPERCGPQSTECTIFTGLNGTGR